MDHQSAIEHYLSASGHEYNVERFKSKAIYRYYISNKETDGKSINVEIFIKPYTRHFHLYAYSPWIIAEEQRSELLNLFAQNNFSNTHFKTELNPSTGDVRCGFSSFLMEECVTPDYLREMERISVTLIISLAPLLQSTGAIG